MTGLLLALVGAYGVHLVFTSVVLRWSGIGPGPRVAARQRSTRVRDWLVQAGLDETRPTELAAVEGVLLLVGGGVAWALFGGLVAPVAGAAGAALVPVAAARRRRERRREAAREAWPRLIEEIRIRTTTLGRSIPQALFDVGERFAPEVQRGVNPEIGLRLEFDVEPDRFFLRVVGDGHLPRRIRREVRGLADALRPR